MDRRFRELLSLLCDSESRDALDRELTRRRWVVTTLEDDDLVARETALGEDFGYKRREVLENVRRAREAIAKGERPPDIADTMQLARHLKWLHQQATNALSDDWPLWSRRRNRRRVTAVAEERLFGVGVLVADACLRTLFDLSYMLAVTTLREDKV